jgi:universal bacterial protein YeaZ
MKIVGLDSAYKFLNICLIQDDEVIDSLHLECFKQQSEWMIPKLAEMMRKNNWKSDDVNAVVISEGPGSYTGVRIAMTVAKVFCSSMNIPLYTLGTLQLYAGTKKNVGVLVDARGDRAYFACYDEGKCLQEECVLPIQQLMEYFEKHQVLSVIGDGYLIGLESCFEDVSRNFVDLKEYWKFVENVDALVPKYLKSNEEYLVK